MPIPGQQWELNHTKQLHLDVGTANDVVKLSIRESENTYQADPYFLLSAAGSGIGKSLLTNNLAGKARFLTAQTPISLSGSERLEFNFVKTSLIDFSVFGMHARTGNLFQIHPEINILKDDGVAANQEMIGAGARAGLGPVSLTVKTKRTRAIVGSSSPWQNSLEKIVSLDVTDALSRLGAPDSEFRNNILPSSIYAGVSNSAQASPAAQMNNGVIGPTTTSRFAGATWGGSNVSADISYYDYFLNSHLIGDANYDYGGKGVSASLSGWTDDFTVTGSASFAEQANLSTSFHDKARSINVYASSTLKLDKAPDVFVEFIGYGSDYVAPAYDTKYRNVAWSPAFGLDLTKYIQPVFGMDHGVAAPSTLNFRSASLKTFYRYQDGVDFLRRGAPIGPGIL